MKYQVATTDEHLKLEKAFSKWWTWFRVEHRLNTLPYHVELAVRIASLEAWIASPKYSKGKSKK